MVLRAVIGAVSRQCGMTRVRNPANAAGGDGYGSGSKGSPYGRGGPGGYGGNDISPNRWALTAPATGISLVLLDDAQLIVAAALQSMCITVCTRS